MIENLRNLLIEMKIRNLKKSLPKDTPNATSLSDAERYRTICQLAANNDYIFSVFKRSADYNAILEHVTRKQGTEYWDLIKKEGQELRTYFPKFQKNDTWGSPFKFNYDGFEFSPTTLRYIKVLLDLKEIFGDLNDWDIIEIGGGYGGQCKIMADVFSYSSYVIADLEVVLPLIRKYLKRLDVENFSCLTQSQIPDKKQYDLLVSNYAFSECVKKIQDEYITKIFHSAKRGYITYNYDGESHPSTPYNRNEIVELLSKVHAIRTLEEKPKTAPQNFIIIWDDTK